VSACTALACSRAAGGGYWRISAFVAAVFLLASLPTAAESQKAPPHPARVEVSAQPIASFSLGDPARRRFGALEFRGGLVLTSDHPTFGGLSSIRVQGDGAHFLSASDRGDWFRGRIAYRDERPQGLADVETAPMLGPDGRPLADVGWYDTEAIAEDGDIVYVGIERVHQIVRFDLSKGGLAARGRPIELPPIIRTLPKNQGIEGLVYIPKGLPLAGTLIAFSERGLDPAGNIRAFLLGGPLRGTFTVKRTDEYDITDAALLPSGDILILERRFSIIAGPGMRIRRIALSSVKPEAVVDGPILIEADMGFEIDNMEGLSVHRATDGATVLTIVSDNNFSPIQRTLLLQFTLLDN
jgi:hypothetical protein